MSLSPDYKNIQYLEVLEQELLEGRDRLSASRRLHSAVATCAAMVVLVGLFGYSRLQPQDSIVSNVGNESEQSFLDESDLSGPKPVDSSLPEQSSDGPANQVEPAEPKDPANPDSSLTPGLGTNEDQQDAGKDQEEDSEDQGEDYEDQQDAGQDQQDGKDQKEDSDDQVEDGDDQEESVDTGVATDSTLPGAGKKVNMGRANWYSGYIHAQILHDLMEELGYDVSSPSQFELDSNLAYQKMAEGGIDFWANSWYPGHLSWLQGKMSDGSTVGDHLERIEGSVLPGGGLQGMLVTKSWAEAQGITTLDQINDDEALWSQLDTDGNGKGEIYGCPEDWSCDNIIASQIEFAGWENLEQVKAGYETMFTEFMDSARAGEPAVIYSWAPSRYFSQAIPGEITMWLSVDNDSVLDDSNPLGQEGGEEYSQRRYGVTGYSKLGADVCLQGPNGCQIGWLAADIEVTANKKWLADNPAAAALFAEFTPRLIDISNATVDYENSRRTQVDVETIAADWLATPANRALANGWLATARAAAGE